jgi:methylthioribulose-1-phosphate dehydratase
MSETFHEISSSLVATANSLHSRGWLLGTSGNLSAVVDREPLRLAITPSGADKGELTTEQVLLIDENCNSVGAEGKPSDESPLHVGIAKALNAGAVIHTHSVWSTVLSDVHATDNGFAIEGYEMLKGLQGVTTHEHREWIPILENSQDMTALCKTMNETLAVNPDVHAFLLRRHGLYTWGRDIKEAKRHVEILEFLLEAVGRQRTLGLSL